VSPPLNSPAEAAPAAPPAPAPAPVPAPAASATAAPGTAATAPALPLAPPAPTPRGGWGFGRFARARIGAEQLTLELYSGRRTPHLLARLVQGYVSAEDPAAPAQPTDLVDAIAALGPALAALQARVEKDGGKLRGVVCDVIIDDSWMLYDVVRADLRGLTPRAADALIGASLADVAGVASSEIISRWQPQGGSAYTLACGLPAATLPALIQVLATQRMVAGSVEGEFVHEYNRHRATLEPTCSVIAVIRDAGAQLGVLIDGVLTAMSFEFGVAAAKELELRGRGLLRAAGVGGAGTVRFYAIAPATWKAPEPWVGLASAT